VNPIPVPSHIHYELLLQLLERQTLPAMQDHHAPAFAPHSRMAREQIQSMIVMVRKAIALQRQLEETLEQQGIPISYRWSLNEAKNLVEEPIRYSQKDCDPASKPEPDLG
jgi:hypothetical protein